MWFDDVDLRLVPCCEARRAVASSLGPSIVTGLMSDHPSGTPGMELVGALMLAPAANPASGWLALGKECATWLARDIAIDVAIEIDATNWIRNWRRRRGEEINPCAIARHVDQHKTGDVSEEPKSRIRVMY